MNKFSDKVAKQPCLCIWGPCQFRIEQLNNVAKDINDLTVIVKVKEAAQQLRPH